MNLRVRPLILWLAIFVLMTLAVGFYLGYRQSQQAAEDIKSYEKYQREVLSKLPIIEDPSELQQHQRR